MELTKLTPESPDVVENMPGPKVSQSREAGRRGCILLLGTVVILALIVLIGILLILSSTSRSTAASPTSLVRVSTINLADLTAANQKLETTFVDSIPAANDGNSLVTALFSTVKSLVPAMGQPNTTIAYSFNLRSVNSTSTTDIDLSGTADERGTQGTGRVYNRNAQPQAEFSYIYVQPLLYVKLNSLTDTQSDQAKVFNQFLNQWLTLDLSKYGTYADKVAGLPQVATATFPSLNKQDLLAHPLFSDPQLSDTAQIEQQNVNCINYKLDYQAIGTNITDFNLPQFEICSAAEGYTPLRLKFSGSYNDTSTELALAVEGVTLNPQPISPPTESVLPLNQLIAPI